MLKMDQVKTLIQLSRVLERIKLFYKLALQNVDNKNRELIIRLLLDTFSLHTLISRVISNKLRLKIL